MKKILSISFLLMIFTSCNLDYAPENTLVGEIIYIDGGTSEAALLGAYVRLNVFVAGAPNDQNNYLTPPYGYVYLLGDIGTNHLTVRSGATNYLSMESSEYTEADHEGFISAIWQTGYNAIDFANNIIDGVQKYGKYSPSLMKQHIAEAKFIRAYAYLTLLQMFGDGALIGESDGLGLIVRLQPYTGYNPEQIQSRVSNAEIYAQIIKDLTEALPDLQQTPFAPNQRYRACLSAAQALLSRVYLYQGSYKNDVALLAQSAAYARLVLDSEGISFSSDYNEYANNLFPSNEYTTSSPTARPDPVNYSNEVIFFQPSRFYAQKYSNGLDDYYRKTQFFVIPEFITAYADGDRRGYVENADFSLIAHGDTTSNPADFTSMKYAGGGYDDVIYIRLSEVKLTYAEASALSQNTIDSEALKQLNDIRRRPFPDDQKPPLLTVGDFVSTAAFVDSVRTERDKELAFEGHTRWDLIRTGQALKDATIPDNRKILPIPNYEVRISEGKIQQNTGYR
ncbi:MAG: RagB/SusD family nutrient uptake outer membrane protein [Candidatus Symbiothrix sp.]|jgi:hypothetical protein|nr:RagB/SusD family nutrient uptake outer membrane protein [Candidatus Symbiothrix sp.]